MNFSVLDILKWFLGFLVCVEPSTLTSLTVKSDGNNDCATIKSGDFSKTPNAIKWLSIVNPYLTFYRFRFHKVNFKPPVSYYILTQKFGFEQAFKRSGTFQRFLIVNSSGWKQIFLKSSENYYERIYGWFQTLFREKVKSQSIGNRTLNSGSASKIMPACKIWVLEGMHKCLFFQNRFSFVLMGKLPQKWTNLKTFWI